jgi:hypothetical protein
MADFRFDVDTTPMAHSVDSTRGHLNGVTAAVTAMQAAVIASEHQASKTICENVDNGFFMLVKSQISQKAVAAYSEMESKQIALLQLAKALDGVKRQMENDFNMIAARYAKLFGSLNKALETRIKELDRPAMQLAEIRKRMVFDKLKDDSSVLFNISSEALPLAQTALSGKLKQKTRDAMQTLSESVEENLSYADKVDSILVKNENDFSDDSCQCFIPAIFLATDSLLNPGDHIENVYTAQTGVWQNTAPVVSRIGLVHSDLNWTPSDADEKKRIRGEFIALCEKELREERLSKEIIRLFDDSVWEECKK